jgi:hypothetical protein
VIEKILAHLDAQAAAGQFTATVKRWRDGQMVLRWIGAALTDASRRLRDVRGYRDMKRLLTALANRTEAVAAISRKRCSMVNASRHCYVAQRNAAPMHRALGCLSCAVSISTAR